MLSALKGLWREGGKLRLPSLQVSGFVAVQSGFEWLLLHQPRQYWATWAHAPGTWVWAELLVPAAWDPALHKILSVVVCSPTQMLCSLRAVCRGSCYSEV